MLFERDRRSRKIEIRNAKKRGTVLFNSLFSPAPFSTLMVVVVPRQECPRADESTQCCAARRCVAAPDLALYRTEDNQGTVRDATGLALAPPLCPQAREPRSPAARTQSTALWLT